VPAARRTEAAERRAAFWRTPSGHVLGAVSIVVVGLVGTRQLITHSTAALVAFGIFVVVLALLALSRDPRVRVADSGVLGSYFIVSGFAHFNGLHSTPIGCLGIFLVLIMAALLVAITRQQKRLGSSAAQAEPPTERPQPGQ
jgi:hypothetical protein